MTFKANFTPDPGDTTQTIVTGAATALNAEALTRTGYTFAGWNTAANGTGTPYADGATVTINAALTLFAQWTPLTYTVTFAAGSAAGATAVSPGTLTKTHDAALTLPNSVTANTWFTRTGFEVTGWSTNPLGTPLSHALGATDYATEGAATLYPVWTATTRNVTYVHNSSTGGTAPDPAAPTYNTNYTVASNTGNLVRAGYTFAGWNTQADGLGTSYTAGSGSFTITSDTTLYARWTPNTLTVTFDSNSGTSVTAGSVLTNAQLTAPTAPTRAGYTFAGWSTTETANNGDLGTLVTFPHTHGQTANFTLYARWTATTRTITYDGNGSTGGAVPAGSPFTVNYDSTYEVQDTELGRSGYTFNGWNTEANGSGTSYAPEATFTVTSNVTLYAQWSPNTLTVTFDSNGGTAVANGSVLTTAQLTAPTAPTRVGFVFAGWSTTETNNNGNSPVITFPYTHGQTANFTLYARWTALDITVTYAAGGATGVVPVQAAVATGGTFTVATAANLSRAGYTFDGWSDGTGKYQPGATYTVGTSAVTLTAQWTVPSAVGTPVALPTNVSASAGNASATVTWQITVGSGELTPVSYVVEFSTDGGTTWSGATVTGTGLSRTVSGLRNGTAYVFRVTAVATNSTATSAQSSAVTPVDPNPVVVPDPVTPTPTKKVTIGTFNGFIAIYTVGYEGSRMSAKVAGRWITVDPIRLVAGKSYSLTRRNTGAGFNIKVDIYIDRQLVASQTVRTR